MRAWENSDPGQANMAKSLSEVIQSGEDSAVEFKSAEFRNDSLAKEIVAFSNMSGGSIFIGVEDNGMVSGVPANGIEERVINICRNLVEPSVIPEIYSHLSTSGAKVLEVRIPKGIFKPYKVKNTNRFYVRIGSVSIEPSTQELVRLLQSGGVYHFEVTSLPGTSIADIDLLRFRIYCERYRKVEFDETVVERLLSNWQLTSDTGQCTMTGALFFGIHLARLLPQAGIQLFRFEGNDRTGALLDQRELSEPIPETIDTAVKFVQAHSFVRSFFPDDSIHRVDVPEYDFFAVRELVVNAFCHRDWSILGQKIRLSLFDDRLEIFSPGSLPNTLSLENALAGVSYYRNPNIAQLCKDYELAEKAGRGLQKIFKIYRERHFSVPEFVNDPTFFQVVLKKNV
jgi:ATP-dependent DNA helicase RecG